MGKRIKTYLNKKVNLNVLGGGLSFLAFLSCFTVGFSSWSLNEDNNKVTIDFEIGDVSDFDYKSSIYYIKNTEKGISSIEINSGDSSSGFFIDTDFSLKIKVNPNYIFTNFGNQDIVKCTFGLKYSIRTIYYYDLFTNSSYVDVPDNFICMLEKNNSRYVLSEDLISFSSECNGITTNIIKGDVNLYSLYDRSLYSITKDYSTKTTDYIYLNVVFPFNINNLLYSTIKDYEINFITSIEGANS